MKPPRLRRLRSGCLSECPGREPEPARVKEDLRLPGVVSLAFADELHPPFATATLLQCLKTRHD